jgi:hypothetical protein
MAFIVCPHCAKPINAQASRCKYCGWQREAVASETPPAPPTVGQVVVHGLVLTVLGSATGIVIGYLVGTVVGMLLASLLVGGGVLHSDTGGWRESNALATLVWFAASGAIVGLFQRVLLQRQVWWNWWWVLVSAVVWAGIAAGGIAQDSQTRTGQLGIVQPIAVLISLVGGLAVSLLAPRHAATPPASA